MFLPPLYTNVPRHLPPPPPPFSGRPISPPSPGAPPAPMSGEEPGLCGLTNNQWHRVLPFVLLQRNLVSCTCSAAVLIALGIAVVISWLNGSEFSFLWLRVQDRAKLTRMGLRERLFGHLLSEDDIHSGLIATGPEITPRRYPNVDFIFAQHHDPSPNANAT